MCVSRARWVRWLVAVVATVSLTTPAWPLVAAHADQQCHECCPERVSPAPVAAHHEGALPQCCLVQAPATPAAAGVAPPVAQMHLAPVVLGDVPSWAERADAPARVVAGVWPPARDTRALRTVVLLV